MGQKVIFNLFERQKDDNVKFSLFLFAMKLIGEKIYSGYGQEDK